MLYSNGDFILKTVENVDDFIIESVTKNSKMNRYDCLCKSGKTLEVLLRWKNGNGIAFPAFQIQHRINTKK
jgi:hypothetical protein